MGHGGSVRGVSPIGVGIVVIGALLSTGCGVVTRPVDVYYRAGWMISNWNDPKFPPKANLCMHTFCTRTDTVKKHVGGRRGYTSEVKYNYCPLHAPSFFAFDSRPDDFLYFIYWFITFFVGMTLGSIPFLVLFGLGHFLWLKVRSKEGGRVNWEHPAPWVAGFVVNTIAWLMFAYW